MWIIYILLYFLFVAVIFLIKSYVTKMKLIEFFHFSRSNRILWETERNDAQISSLARAPGFRPAQRGCVVRIQKRSNKKIINKVFCLKKSQNKPCALHCLFSATFSPSELIMDLSQTLQLPSHPQHINRWMHSVERNRLNYSIEVCSTIEEHHSKLRTWIF